MSIVIRLGGRTAYILASEYGEGFVRLSGCVVKASNDPAVAAQAVHADRRLADWASTTKRPVLIDRNGTIHPLAGKAGEAQP